MRKITKKEIIANTETTRGMNNNFSYNCHIGGLLFHGSGGLFMNAVVNSDLTFENIGDFEDKKKFVSDVSDFLNNTTIK